MNVVVNLKEPQLKGVLEVLGKTGDTLNIVVNIKDAESEEKVPGPTSSTGECTEKEEKEGETKEEPSEETTW